MPNWKKVIVSGSDASLNSLSVASNVNAQSFTGSLFGTSSYADKAGIGRVYISDEGSLIGSASYLDFTGTNVTATINNDTASIAISGGGGGEGLSVLFTQSSPTGSWVFVHNLGSTYVNVDIYDSGGNVIIPQNISASLNKLNIDFGTPTSGYAVATVGGGLPAISASYANFLLAVNQTGTAATWVSASQLSVTSASYALTASYAANVPETSSYAISALSASYSNNSSTSDLALNANTASYVELAQSASYVLNAISASYAASTSNVEGGQNYRVALWDSDTSLSSSYLNQSGSVLKTIYNGADKGLTLDYNFDSFILGNAGTGNNTYLQVYDGGSTINVYSPNYTYFNDKVGVRIIPTNPGFAVSGALEITGPGTSKFMNSNVQITGSLIATNGITGSLLGTASSAINILGGNTNQILFQSAPNQTTSSANFTWDRNNSRLFIGEEAGSGSSYPNDTNFLGAYAGYAASGSSNSNFLGNGAGSVATNANDSNFLGDSAGESATNANNSNFLGKRTGESATNAQYSNFLGWRAGFQATNAGFSSFIGRQAGYQATNSSASVFIGDSTGFAATNANYSTFIGQSAGSGAVSASYSVLLGYNAGYNPNYASVNGINSNNIIIGNSITLPNDYQNGINIGGLIFGSGSYSNLAIISQGSANGKIGINQPLPKYSLDVSGSGNYTNGLTVTGSIVSISGITGSLFGTSSWSENAITASYSLTSSYVNSLNQNVSITGSLTATGDIITKGNIIAQQYIISSSVSYFTESFSSGSTKFGDSLDDTHQFTGSVNITGSFSLQNTLTSYYNISSTAGSNTVLSVNTQSFNGAFFKYTAVSQSNARTGEIMASWVGNSISFNEVSTTDIGSTAGLTFTSSLSTNNIELKATTSTSGWSIRVLATYL